mgnify:CR=1 FL=1
MRHKKRSECAVSLIIGFYLVILEQIWEKATGASNMPYVNRNQAGEITQLLDKPSNSDSQWLEMENPEVSQFLQDPNRTEALKKSLLSSDVEMARVVEDLVEVLMEKQVFVFTELPEVAQQKLNARKKLREDVGSLNNLIGDEDDIL